MITIPLVFLGTGLMTYAVYFGLKLIGIILDQKSKRRWYVALALILFFLLGYGVYLFLLYNSLSAGSIENQLISTILFFGALFVTIILRLCYDLISGVNVNFNEIRQSNEVLIQKSNMLKEKDSELVTSKHDLELAKEALEKKNKELEKALEDFYTMRVGVHEDLRAGKFDEENARIKAKLDELRIFVPEADK